MNAARPPLRLALCSDLHVDTWPEHPLDWHALAEATPADVQQGGSALKILGSVGGGVFLGAPPVGTSATDTTTDANRFYRVVEH